MKSLLARFQRGELELEDVVRALDRAPLEDLEFATVDHHRALRHGFPEVVYCPGKTVPQVLEICESLSRRGEGFLATRASEEMRDRLHRKFPETEVNELGRTVYLPAPDPPEVSVRGPVLIVTAGTSDIPVAEEAAVSARAMGNPVRRLDDVGVAGLHRLLHSHDELQRAEVIVAVAGMEAALASVIAGLVRAPVVAVPTSVGYGASFAGLAALLALLNSCAPGVVVVNIDNGYGAAAAATRINRLD